jgi:hypothetical protein
MLSILPALAVAGNDRLKEIGYYHENGIYEPGYVNYHFDNSTISETAGTSPIIGGHYDENGIFEAGYVNYRFSKTMQRDVTDIVPMLGGYFNDVGIFEPAYLNYRIGQYSTSSHLRNCQSSGPKGTIDKNVC